MKGKTKGFVAGLVSLVGITAGCSTREGVHDYRPYLAKGDELLARDIKYDSFDLAKMISKEYSSNTK